MSSLTAQTILTSITSNGNHQIIPSEGTYLKEIDITSNINTNPSIQQNVTKLLDNNQNNYSIIPDNGYDGISNIDIQLQQSLNKNVNFIKINNIELNKQNYVNYIGTNAPFYNIAIEYIISNGTLEINDIELVYQPLYQDNHLLIPVNDGVNHLEIMGPNIHQSFRIEYHF